MTITAVAALGVGLSMDAFAAALGQGAANTLKKKLPHALTIGLLFGFAQATMPLLGYNIGAAFHDTIKDFDHWIAFVLLGALGLAMIRAGLDENGKVPAMASGYKLVALAVATSIDAAAAGMTLTLLGVPVLIACTIIGAITFCISTTGTLVGGAIGTRLGKSAEFLGGGILIAQGIRIVIMHIYFP